MRKANFRMNEKEKDEIIKNLVDNNGNKKRAPLIFAIRKNSTNKLVEEKGFSTLFL